MLIKVAVVAAAFAVALFPSATANAEPDPAVPVDPAAPVVDVKAACESPDFGGVFVPGPAAADGATHAECQYIVEGQFYYDNYDNGAYTGTLVYRDGGKVPTERPVMPGTFTMPGGGPAPMVVFPGQF